MDCKEIQPVHPKGNQSWTFIGRTDAEAETPIPWPPDGKNQLIWIVLHTCFLGDSKLVWHLQLLKNFPQFVVIHTVESFSIVSEADVFLEFLCFFYYPEDLTIWSLVPLPFLNPDCLSGFSVHVLLNPSLKDFEHYFASMWNESNWMVVWTFLSIALLCG